MPTSPADQASLASAPLAGAPLVSVVIPTCDRPDALAEALESVRAQTVDDYEIVVVDDASGDAEAVAEAVRRAAGARLLRSHRPGGGAAARNRGVAAARGRLVAFLDDDDLWRPDKLARQLALLAASPDPERTLVYSALDIRGRHGTRRLPARGLAEGEDVGDYLWRHGGWMQTSSFLAPRRLLTRVAFRAALPAHQDWDLVIRLAAAGVHFRFDPEPLVVYRDDGVGKRLSRRARPQASLAWLESVRGLISPAAYRTFRARRAPLMARLEPAAGLAAIAEAWRGGDLGALRTARLLAGFALAGLSPAAYRALPELRRPRRRGAPDPQAT
jgi:glycosyltransferase involved in cell wall biosynthesis